MSTQFTWEKKRKELQNAFDGEVEDRKKIKELRKHLNVIKITTDDIQSVTKRFEMKKRQQSTVPESSHHHQQK